MTLSSKRKSFLLDSIGGHFCGKAIEAVQEQKSLRGTGDNLDMRILTGYMTKELQKKDFNMFSSNVIVNQINFNHLPNETQSTNLSKKNFPD